MFLTKGRVVISPSDVAQAAQCEFAIARALDGHLGWASRFSPPEDPLMTRTAQLGNAHEERVLEAFRERFGADAVLEMPAASAVDPTSLLALHAATIEALRGGAPGVSQGTFFDGRLLGRADFLVRQQQPAPAGGVAYAVHEAKLARRAKVTALIQAAAYADQLEGAGIPLAREVYLELGSGAQSGHQASELVAVYRERRARLEAIIEARLNVDEPVAWGDEALRACGRCESCAEQVTQNRDLVLVANLRLAQRVRLRAAGIVTIEQLAASTGSVPGMKGNTVARLRAQAALQVAQDADGTDGTGVARVRHEVIDLEPIRRLPPASPGDLYFDFEGDPLWTGDSPADAGLEYLFGLIEADTGQFKAFWAHDRAEEKQALVAFLDYVEERRSIHPDLHIYHYAPYEKTALQRLIGRHGVGEMVLTQLLKAGVLVDLYATVRASVLISQPSYSIKKLEPLYMGSDLRTGVDNAADSIVAYAEACAARESGDEQAFDEKLSLIAKYNEYDCRSTLELRSWLVSLLPDDDAGQDAAGAVASDEPTGDGSAEPKVETEQEGRDRELHAALLSRAEQASSTDEADDRSAWSMLGAALGYHRREQLPFWWFHFDRLTGDENELESGSDFLLPDSVTVDRDWFKEGRQRVLRRQLRLTAAPGHGATMGVGSTVFLHFAEPLPCGLRPPKGCARATHDGKVIGLIDEPEAAGVVVEETLPKECAQHACIPVAVSAGPPPATKNQEAAISELAQRTLDAGLDGQPAVDILRRRAPRLAGGVPLPAVGTGADAYIAAITQAVLLLDHSYLAVQGPPGTGKTHNGAAVIKRLIDQGWRVGVVAQSHAVVEHLLDRVVGAGVPAAQVGKVVSGGGSCGWTVLPANGQADFLAEHAGVGCVVGGTAWDFTNTQRIDRGALDLLVIDEAGQFSLADTLAVSVSAQRLLLLGDPQQLPQVSQGTHPEPVDESPLGWIMHGHDTLPAELGYFLATTWRMHPALCERVSRLSYEDRLRSEDGAGERHLDGLAPGVHTVVVEHEGNSTRSPEEAEVVADQVRSLLGLIWTDPTAPAPRELDENDVLVVAAYNAQVAEIRSRLASDGLAAVRVGTVDKFQGQEAPVVVVSMAASAVEDVPRGMGFLLSRNRVNVAVSRAQWAAIVVRSRRLTDYLPTTPDNLVELGAFIELCRPIGMFAGR